MGGARIQYAHDEYILLKPPPKKSLKSPAWDILLLYQEILFLYSLLSILVTGGVQDHSLLDHAAWPRHFCAEAKTKVAICLAGLYTILSYVGQVARSQPVRSIKFYIDFLPDKQPLPIKKSLENNRSKIKGLR